MKIGVLTMHKVKNHGSFLQAYALCNLIKEISGEDVSLIDFSSKKGIIDPCKESYKRFKSSRIRYALISLAAAFSDLPILDKMLIKNKKIRSWRNLLRYYRLYNDKYERKFWKHLPFLNKTLKNADIDFLVIGSDEVFNYKVNNAVGYSDELFGEGSPTDNIISFSACFGNTDITDIDDELKAKLSGYLSRFKGISVRDKNSEQIIRALVGDEREIGYHLDPVFHYSFEPELPKIKRKKPYLVLYAYDGLEEEFKARVKEYADSRGLEIVCLHGYQGDFGEYVSASPFEVLSYIKNAECVVTTTFHGSVFSIKFNKPFCVLLKEHNKKDYNNNSKLKDLLLRMNLMGQATKDFADLEKVIERGIDYTEVNKMLDIAVGDGISYLKSILES